MCRIPLTRGKFALVDDGDFGWLDQWKWHYTHYGYAARRNSRKEIVLMHRLILCAPRGMEVDHKNCDRLDNRRENIRLCTRGQNNANRERGRGRSVYKGVWQRSDSKRWASEIKYGGIKHCLGTYDMEEDAATAYDKAAKELFGEFARVNFDANL